ncbi:unnamed protein product [Strongylus vulgaris]|uniref:Uncharacterized protein n=1 Tax=Strongylus vulgaris TaxID=40348 RepID=A0A3P7KWK0_STRVU|nr:unnamed protein product [Strongylus vulgaris]
MKFYLTDGFGESEEGGQLPNKECFIVDRELKGSVRANSRILSSQIMVADPRTKIPEVQANFAVVSENIPAEFMSLRPL